MKFFIPTLLALMATAVSARTCIAGAIVCSYNNGGACIVPCVFKCRCPPDWNGGHNSKSGCGIITRSFDQCIVD
ncbi:hypothetical protein HYFRA_00012814 [Hymenoscyphus fraxineus]|uniref:Extracellular membrane protein CFEM domain-containing protein n=1 Tax=Hymenoscyphus fraxineus TaxID=746836 RepID=A0A9N9L726_9HELO|nr:hypothetical protein HYFRA_00012814 [Hymenoscyphus fraxineus]